MAYVPRLRKEYDDKIKSSLVEEYSYSNVMEVPKLKKIVISRGVGGAVADFQPAKDLGESMNEKAAVAANAVFGGVKAVAKGVVKLGKTGPKRLVDWLRGK